MGTSDLESLLRDPQVRAEYTRLPADQAAAWAWRMMWLTRALKHQILPTGDWWSIWLMLAGRGAGKTRTAAEQVAWWAWSYKATRWLVAAPTSSDVRGTCFEGDSGLLSVIPAILIDDYNKALHELRLTNGSLIKGIPASEPERFRGPQFHGGWLDELAAWEYIQEAWDQIQFGMRLKLDGMKTRLICTTTPKPRDLIIELMSRENDDVVLTTASTYANIDNLSENFRRQILSYEGTNLGRQEIFAEIIDAEVYNIGGGKDNSCSIFEAFNLAEQISGNKMIYEYIDENRIGDHICYYSDLSKMKEHYPEFNITKNLNYIIENIYIKSK